ncbi:MAG: histidine kinase [Schaalia hyovaginalis]|uniref:histidine kinase n=1 Tax=Schaalia hyovaginalis TaxID=29316 RepID=UPI002A908D12|nr:histidine kinase [Schaalia hyovaginalis]MDY6212991.1 histidine kinase [Schaalia hyovaginalis]
MSSADARPVTVERIGAALESMGIFPFVSDRGQVAALLPSRTIRIIVPEGRPVQGVSDYPRRFHASYTDALNETVRTLNASTYLPKVTTFANEDSTVSVRFLHCFNWAVGATDAQLRGEISQFVMSAIAMQNRLDVQYPDQWAEEAPHA